MDRCRRQLDPLVDAFRDGTLPREVWSHEAHLLVAWVLLGELGDVDRTVEELRDLIGAYNRASGVPEERADCHLTLTRFYVEAIAAAAPTTIAELLVEPSCSRRAPARHWSLGRLGSRAARHGWVAPDRAPLPWSPRRATDALPAPHPEPDAESDRQPEPEPGGAR